jgi:DNA polymerase III epsilon subunit-like protein
MHAAALPGYNVTPTDFFWLGFGVQADHDSLPEPPPPVPVCIEAGQATVEIDAEEGVQGEADADLHTPRGNGKQNFVQRPELEMAIFDTGKPVLCWDTETAGLGAPAICQLAYMLVTVDGTIRTYDKIMKLPEGVHMSQGAMKIHGITAAAAKQGADPANELLAFWQLAQQVLAEGGTVVGHNVSFDCRAFNYTSEKLGLTHTLEHGHMLDTMRESKTYSPLKTSRGHKKAFKNDELYTFFFDAPPTWAALHNAADDVFVTILNYQEGKRRSWW